MTGDFFQPQVDVDEIVSKLEQDDVFDLVMGKKVNGIKLDKETRRELKFAIKRDANSEEILAILTSFIKTQQKTIMRIKPVLSKPQGPTVN